MRASGAPVAVVLFAVSLAVTLAAARLFARRLDRLGARFGLPEALVGLLTALAADGPEISSALVALAKGAHGASVGVVVGSNVFNLAAMIGVSALVAGSVRLPAGALALEGLVGAVATLIGAGVLLGWLAPVVGAVGLCALLGPYLALLIDAPRLLGRLPVGRRLAAGLGPALSQHREPVRPRRSGTDPTHHLFGLIVADVCLIVAGSTGMVESALALGERWQISGAVLGVFVLAPLTSLPNAFTAVRLGREGRGSALVSETFNSNTINLAAGVVIPAMFVSLGGVSATGKLDLVWLIAMTVAVVALLARPRGLGRVGAAALLGAYLAFVAVGLGSA